MPMIMLATSADLCLNPSPAPLVTFRYVSLSATARITTPATPAVSRPRHRSQVTPGGPGTERCVWVHFLVNLFPGGNAGQIIATRKKCPIMLLVFACLDYTVCLSEIKVSILLIPAAGGNAGPQTNDADLTAYGVGGNHDMGTTVSS